MPPAEANPSCGDRGRYRGPRGSPPLSSTPGRTSGGRLLSCPVPACGQPPTATSCARHRGHRPYLSLQRHSPQGQAAHGLICYFPPPHREVVEGVGQLLGVILRRDLKQSGKRQWPSAPVGAWASRWRCVPSWWTLERCPCTPTLLVDRWPCPTPAPRPALSLLPSVLQPSTPVRLQSRNIRAEGAGPGFPLPCPPANGHRPPGLSCCPRAAAAAPARRVLAVRSAVT